ncbi:MAG: hypothetical protein ACE5LC_09995 [Candidatus Aminicenantales bacterium]
MIKDRISEKHTVAIRVDDEGEFKYDNGLIWVYPKDTIIWQCEYPFSIHIGWHSPLKKGRFQSENSKDIVTVVPDDARPGYYRYTVAALVKGKIWTDDPEFIVKRP